jgi:oligopeptide transport system ATP-binding protein
MYAGHRVEIGTVDDIFYSPRHPYTTGLLRSIPRLDSEEKERLIPIDGTPVDMLNPPPGCPFAPRCADCMKICLREYPPAADYGGGHYASCWLRERDIANYGR